MLSKSQHQLIGHLMTSGPLSRKRLTELMGLSKSALTLMTHKLTKQNIVQEEGVLDTGGVGRREVLLNVVPDYMHAIGLDIKPKEITLTVLNMRTKIVHKENHTKIDRVIAAIAQIAPDYRRIQGIGVTLRKFHRMNTPRYKNLMDKISALGYPVFYMNDVAALAIAYKVFQSNQKDLMVIKYGPGVESALIINHNLMNDEEDKASEIGHSTVDVNSKTTLEDTIKYDTLFDGGLDEDEVIETFKHDRESLDKVIDYLAWSIYNAHTFLSIPNIIIAGQIFAIDSVFEQLRDALLSYETINQPIALHRITDYKTRDLKKSAFIPFYYTYVNART
ncbi:MAG: ROK family transcriptional regulator [Bacillota bacterium]